MPEKKSIDKWAIVWYGVITVWVVICAIIILGKACIVLFKEGEEWRKVGLKQIHHNIEVLADRGNIYDIHHELLAITEYQYRLFIDFCAKGIKEDTLKKYVESLSEKLYKMFPQKTAEQYRKHILSGWETRFKCKRNYRLLDCEVNFFQWKEIQKMPYFNQGRNNSGLYYSKSIKRTKPYGFLASRSIGNVYREIGKGGKNGLEKYYNNVLSGKFGISTRKKINGQYINVVDVEPVRGKDIITTIDISIQDIVENALFNKLKELDAESGIAIIMEVSTGEIRAIANLGKIGEEMWGEIKNYAVSDLSEPGSTFKVASMMVALESGLIHSEDSVDTGAGIAIIAGRILKDHNFEHGGYGKITVSKTIRYSSNIGIALLIESIYGKNPEKYIEDLYKIGLNQDMKLEIPGYEIPYIRHPKNSSSRYWAKTTLPWMSFGYGVQIPPIYLLAFFNAIANNGKLIKPIFVKEIMENGRIIEREKTQIINSKICSSSTLSIIRKMLDDVVNMSDGTGKSARSGKVRIAGKTGTAQISHGEKGYKFGSVFHQMSFCGYFPANKPKYSGIVVIRKPKKGIISGGIICGVVFKNIVEKIYAKNIFYHLGIGNFKIDTLHALYPTIKDGNINNIINIFKSLKISYKDMSKGSIWVTSKYDTMSKQIILYKKNIISSRVPDVEGMGAKDAIFVLENVGLKVTIFGKGKVVKQSIFAGEKIIKGEKIVLELK